MTGELEADRICTMFIRHSSRVVVNVIIVCGAHFCFTGRATHYHES